MPPMPPIPPMPPPPPCEWPAPFSSGRSATATSVVTMSAATDDASCSAVRTTFIGSMIPCLIMSHHVPLAASKPQRGSFCSSSLPTMTSPARPALTAMACRRRGGGESRNAEQGGPDSSCDGDGGGGGAYLHRLAHCALDDLDADAQVLVGRRGNEGVERAARVQERDAAARDDALINGRARRVERVDDAVLLLAHLDLGRAADLDDGNAARELREALLQRQRAAQRARAVQSRFGAPRFVGAASPLTWSFSFSYSDDVAAACSRMTSQRSLIASLDPPPCMMSVSSLEIVIFLAEPRCSSVVVSSLRPTSSEMTVPPVSSARSCRLALRLSPKPGALTAAILSPPRSLLRTSDASASDSTSSAMMTSERFSRTTASRMERICCSEETFFSTCEREAGGRSDSERGDDGRRPAASTHEENVGVLELDALRLGVVDEVGRDVAAVELHALDGLELVMERAAVLHRDDALLAHLLHRAREELADLAVAVRGDRADLQGGRAGG